MLFDLIDQLVGVFHDTFLIACRFTRIRTSLCICPNILLFADYFVDVLQNRFHASTFGFNFTDAVFTLQKIEQRDKTCHESFLTLNRISKLRIFIGKQFVDHTHLTNNSFLLALAMSSKKQFRSFRICPPKLLGHLHEFFFKSIEATQDSLLADIQRQFFASC